MAQTDVNLQIEQLATQIARRVLLSSRPTFALVESAADGSQMSWPACHIPDSIQSATANCVTPHFLRHTIETRLPSGGAWCVIDGLGAADAKVRLQLAHKKKSRTSVASFTVATPIDTPIELQLGDLLSNADERRLCKMITELSKDFEWVGFYLLRSDLQLASLLLRHCELVFAAIDGSQPIGKKLERLLKLWKREGIPLQAACLVAA